MKAKHLPIYEDRFANKEVAFVPNPPTQFTETVSSVRKAAASAGNTTMNSLQTVTDKVNTGRAHTASLLETLQEDPSSLMRAGVITIAGFGGIVAGYRKGILRRGLYCGIAMGAAASLCYPNQAVDLANTGYARAKSEVKPLWDSMMKKEKTTQTEETPNNTNEAMVGDQGQSKPGDQDMYTNRNSLNKNF